VSTHIIALGGGGFGSEPENPALDRYILAQARARCPRVCFVPTASGDDAGYVERFEYAFSRYECRPSCLRFFDRTPEVASFVREQDVIFVGGGNTRSMLAVWREWGLVEPLRGALGSGTVLAGVSAGAICWFEQGLTDSCASRLEVLDCLGFLPGSCTPHYDGEPDRRPSYLARVAGAEIRPGYGLDDGAAVHFVDGRFSEAVASRPNARAYRVARDADGGPSEVPLPTRFLQPTA
jgi:peptidase E